MNDINTLVWRDEFSTGVEEIDEQHKILIHTLQEARQILTSSSSIEVMDKITRDLLAYALYHFDTEEELMNQYGYEEKGDELDAHLAQHRNFSAKVVSTREGLKTSNPITPDELLSFLSDWLSNHILNTDKKLGAHICAQRSK